MRISHFFANLVSHHNIAVHHIKCRFLHENITLFKTDSVEIKCTDNVTLLHVTIDFMLSFDDHVTDICKKA